MSRVELRRGTEGPRHDPYSYTEVTVVRDSSPWFQGQVTYHDGLDEWVRVDRNRPIRERPREMFQRLAGVSPETAENSYREFRDRKIRYHACGQQHLRWVSGFPGEKLLWCERCRHILDGTFNKSAVE